MIGTLVPVSVVCLSLAAVVIDLKCRRIPNWLTVPAFGTGITVGWATGGVEGLGASLAGAGLGGLILLWPVLQGGMGGGDLKFQAAIGALMGPAFAAVSFMLAASLGAVIGLAYVAWLTAIRRRPMREALAAKFAYGPALAGGALGALSLGFGL